MLATPRPRPPDTVLGGASYLVSGLAFLVGTTQLIRLEGPGSPDLSVTLSEPSGRAAFTLMLFIFALAVVASGAGTACLYLRLRAARPYAALAALVLSLLADALFLSLLTFQYTLVALVAEGLDPSGSQFHFFAVLAHAAGDFSGWISIGLWGVTSVLVALVPSAGSTWRAVRYSAWAFVGVLLVLYLLSASYAYLVLFALWEVVVAVHLIQSERVGLHDVRVAPAR